MSKMFQLVILALPLSSLACDGYVIGFGGLNGVFDEKAFVEYANKQMYCAKSYAWQDQAKAKVFINSITVPYHLYGFSKGAETVSKVLKSGIKPPEYIITVGAYKTADVNFTKYDIPFVNYFDNSGRGQKSPGIFLNRTHTQMQSSVNSLIPSRKTNATSTLHADR